MRNTVYYTWFIKSLTKEQKEDYQQRSINQQKDWYISYLEAHFDPSWKTFKYKQDETLIKFEEDENS